MREITGNLWHHYGQLNVVACITTNGTVKRNGESVMGRGCAREAMIAIPGLALELGRKINAWGNQPHWLHGRKLLSFPVKHSWWETADLELIAQSACKLNLIATEQSHLRFVLPRPGCGNGQRQWSEVKPRLEFLRDNIQIIDFAR